MNPKSPQAILKVSVGKNCHVSYTPPFMAHNSPATLRFGGSQGDASLELVFLEKKALENAMESMQKMLKDYE